MLTIRGPIGDHYGLPMTGNLPIQIEGEVEVPTRRRKAKSGRTLRLYFYWKLLALDILIILGVPVLLSFLFIWFDARYDVRLTLPIVPLYVVIAINGGAYSLNVLKRPIESVRVGVSALLTAQISLLVVIFFLKQSGELSRLAIGIGAISTIAALAASRLVFGQYVRRKTNGRMTDELLLIDGMEPALSTDGIRVAYADELSLVPDLKDPKMLHRFGMLAKSYDRILVASVPERRKAWTLLLKGADIDGEILMEESNELGAIGIGDFQGRDTLLVSRKPLSLPNRIKKRSLDLAITVPLLILLAPMLALVAILIKLEDGGPVLFKQDRVGRGNCLFKVLKFRSMRVEQSDADGSRSATRDDDRITRIGRFIRSTSIDELPQLFNVLIGDMSLVGPRPHALGSLAGTQLFWEIDQTYWHRHQLTPGITGLAQIRGHRGATHDTSDLVHRLKADMEYVQGWDIWRDISILFSTFRVIIHRNAF